MNMTTQTPEEKIDVLIAAREGKPTQWQSTTGTWVAETTLATILGRFQQGYEIRIAPEPPKYRPWKSLAEVPLDAWFNSNTSTVAEKITQICTGDSSVYVAGGWHTLQEVFVAFQHSHNGINWLPCGVEEGAR